MRRLIKNSKKPSAAKKKVSTKKTFPPDSLRLIPGVGEATEQDFHDLGIHAINNLIGVDPETLYKKLCWLRNTKIDRCQLYVFRCAVYFAENKIHDPEKLKWWNWKD